MDNQAFLNRLRSLFNIDGDLLPELTKEQQREFVLNPVLYLMRTDDDQADAIMREVEKRQKGRASSMFDLVHVERQRCIDIVQLAREGEIDGDLRSIIHRIKNP